MNFTVKVKNFGKIDKATLQFKDLTVLAGSNNTGKSYISRVLYCILDALTIDHQKYYYSDAIGRFADSLPDNINNSLHSSKDAHVIAKLDSIISKFLLEQVEVIESQILSADKDSVPNDMSNRDEYFRGLIMPMLSEKDALMGSINDLLITQKGIAVQKYKYNFNLNSLDAAFNLLEKDVRLERSKKNSIGCIKYIHNSLKDNFQVNSLRSLVGEKDEDATIEININQDRVLLKIDKKGDLTGDVQVTDKSFIANVLHLASPMHWIIHSPISALPIRKLIGKRQYLGGIPKYVHDSYAHLGLQSIGELDASIAGIAKDIEKTIRGIIKYDTTMRKLEFFKYKKGTTEIVNEGISLLLAATGIVQLGMLGFFVKNRIIDRDTILFIDEPEAHLHTEWQEKIMQVLYALKEYGVKVVIATHGPTIMQRLELDFKKQNTQNGVALNLFTKDGRFDNTGDDFKTTNREIARSMNEAPYRMFLKE